MLIVKFHFSSTLKSGTFFKMLITSKVFELQVRFDAQIEDNSKTLPNLMSFFKFDLHKVEITCREKKKLLLLMDSKILHVKCGEVSLKNI